MLVQMLVRDWVHGAFESPRRGQYSTGAKVAAGLIGAAGFVIAGLLNPVEEPYSVREDPKVCAVKDDSVCTEAAAHTARAEGWVGACWGDTYQHGATDITVRFYAGAQGDRSTLCR